ncbi:MAG: phytoene/squalene synthase family protein [Flavobacteriales bacterium]
MTREYNALSYQCSRHVTAAYSTSFSLAVKMLTPSMRDPIHAIYGFVRFADEIVDSFHTQDQERILNEFEDELNKSLERQFSINPILNSFQGVVHQYGIDRDLIDAFLKSMRADLYQKVYSTRKDYEDYIYGSAEVVGLMCLKVFVNGDQAKYEELKEPAIKLGSAFQKVNFLRDLKDDTLTLQRSYFPNASLNGLNPHAKTSIINEIEEEFHQALDGIKRLPFGARFGVYTAYVYYIKLLSKLRSVSVEQMFSERIRISNLAKIRLLFTSFVNYKLNLI